MARRATVIKDYRAKTPHLLVLDAGDALFGQPVSDISQGKALTEAMGLMKYDAMAIGERDLAHFPELLDRSREAKFAFLSANLVYADSGKPVFTPYIVQDMGGRKVAIIGLTPADDTFKSFVPPSMNITAKDPLETAREYVAKARADKVDAVVILSHLGNVMDRKIATEVDGITAIVGGHSYDLLQETLQLNNTVIGQAGYGGEWLGEITVDFDAEGNVTSAKAGVIPLTEEYADDPELAALAARYNAALPPTPTVQP
ncbi:MAG: bifunctional metallophosphatase/5'-nucleotidase [Anaerolineae bacterium]